MDFYIGELRIFPYNRIPAYWKLCDGSLLAVQTNQALFSLLGYKFGGDKNTFAIPDLRGRMPIGTGMLLNSPNQYALANKGGVETVTLSSIQGPAHIHYFMVQNTAASTLITANPDPYLANPTNINAYNAGTTTTPLNSSTLNSQGGSAAHPNMQPFIVQNICIAINGTYPPRN